MDCLDLRALKNPRRVTKQRLSNATLMSGQGWMGGRQQVLCGDWRMSIRGVFWRRSGPTGYGKPETVRDGLP